MRALGLPVALSAAGDFEALAPGVQLTGYRIVQEGLTNVLKHAGTVQTEVVIRIADSDRLAVRIASAAGEQRAGLPGSASGLRGLQERVEATGGTLTTTRGGDGVFVIDARLPVTAETS